MEQKEEKGNHIEALIKRIEILTVESDMDIDRENRKGGQIGTDKKEIKGYK